MAITGIGVVPRVARADRPFHEVAFDAARKALADAGLSRGDLDSVVLAGLDLECGRTISNMYASGAAGGYLKDEIRVADDGLFAAALAWMRIRSGLFDTTLVLAYGAASEGPAEGIANLVFDPVYQRPFGAGRLLPLAMQAAAYAQRAPRAAEAADAYAVEAAAAAGEDATALGPPGDAPRQTPVAAPPLRRGHVAPLCDGAAALVMQTGELARRARGPAARVCGFGWSAESGDLGQRDLAAFASTRDAAQLAYRSARATDLDVRRAELHDVTAYHAMMAAEAVGLAGRDRAPEAFLANAIGPRARRSVNARGGSMGGEPSVASGLYRLARAAEAARKEGGISLAHSVSGPAAQMACVSLVAGWDA